MCRTNCIKILIALGVLLDTTAPRRVEAAPDQPPAATDHAAVTRRLGLGYVGVSGVPISPGDLEFDHVSAPALGLRWWWSERVGFDLAVGVWYTERAGQSGSVSGSGIQDPYALAFTTRVGVPYAVYIGRHYTFLLQADVMFGFAQERAYGERRHGFIFEGLIQGGAEIQLGFIGLPELALQGTVGVFVRHEWLSADNPHVSVTTMGTNVTNDPWDFFRTAVAARYYF